MGHDGFDSMTIKARETEAAEVRAIGSCLRWGLQRQSISRGQ